MREVLNLYGVWKYPKQNGSLSYFDENDRDDIQEMWNHFKSLGCYDECDDTVDTDVFMTGIETYGVEVEIN